MVIEEENLYPSRTNISSENGSSSPTTLEVLGHVDNKMIEDIYALHGKSFPENFHLEKEYYKEMLENKRNINVIIKENKEIIGYLLARLHNDAVEDLKGDDPDLKTDDQRYYVEIIEVAPERRAIKNFLRLLDTFFKEARKREGINKYSMHARKNNRLSEVIQKIFPKSSVLRTIDNWQNTGEPFDYLEVEIEKDLYE